MSDLFQMFKKIDECDINYYENQSDDERKKIALFVVARWMTGTNDSNQILMINNFINSKIWKLYNHQELVYKLLCVSSTGKKNYKWIGKKKTDNKSETLKLIMNYYDCSKRDAKEFIEMLSYENILDMAEDLAVEKELLTKIKKENK